MRLTFSIAALFALVMLAPVAQAQSVVHSERSYVDPQGQWTAAGWVASAVYELTLQNVGSTEQRCDVTWEFFDGRAGQWRSSSMRLYLFPNRSETSVLRGARAGTARWTYRCN